MGILNFLHVISAVLWVGGMFFAYAVLRPVAAVTLEPPLRLPLWVGCFGRFFPWVWAAVILLPITGYTLAFTLFGSFDRFPLYVHLMQGLGIAMLLIYLHVYFGPFRRLRNAVEQQNWAEGGKRLAQIRRSVGLNLALGIIIVLVASGGRFVPV